MFSRATRASDNMSYMLQNRFYTSRCKDVDKKVLFDGCIRNISRSGKQMCWMDSDRDPHFAQPHVKPCSVRLFCIRLSASTDPRNKKAALAFSRAIAIANRPSHHQSLSQKALLPCRVGLGDFSAKIQACVSCACGYAVCPDTFAKIWDRYRVVPKLAYEVSLWCLACDSFVARRDLRASSIWFILSYVNKLANPAIFIFECICLFFSVVVLWALHTRFARVHRIMLLIENVLVSLYERIWFIQSTVNVIWGGVLEQPQPSNNQIMTRLRATQSDSLWFTRCDSCDHWI